LAENAQPLAGNRYQRPLSGNYRGLNGLTSGDHFGRISFNGSDKRSERRVIESREMYGKHQTHKYLTTA
jgi:hypothetical protein